MSKRSDSVAGAACEGKQPLGNSTLFLCACASLLSLLGPTARFEWVGRVAARCSFSMCGAPKNGNWAKKGSLHGMLPKKTSITGDPKVRKRSNKDPCAC